MTDFQVLMLLFVSALIVRSLLLKSGPADTPAGAIVMANGIFLLGALHSFPFLDDRLGDIFALLLFIVWLCLAASYVRSAVTGTMKEAHLAHPIKSFAVGTWVAGTSVVVSVMVQRFGEWGYLFKVLAVLNLFLWLFFVVVCLRNFRRIWTDNLYKNAHGVILLSTVGTQSIVVSFYNAFGKAMPSVASAALIVIGILFYSSGFYLIIKRYKAFRKWRVADDWQNTNCILHGAMSITGLAGALTHAVPAALTLAVWIWVIIWFVIVEAIELWRLVSRLSKYGPIQGIGTYNVTQWSRNFTFGMFYAFTMQFDLTTTPFACFSAFTHARAVILGFGRWLVLLFLINEILLYFKAKTVWKRAAKSRAVPDK